MLGSLSQLFVDHLVTVVVVVAIVVVLVVVIVYYLLIVLVVVVVAVTVAVVVILVSGSIRFMRILPGVPWRGPKMAFSSAVGHCIFGTFRNKAKIIIW